MFWDNFNELCEKQGKKPNNVALEIGCSSGSITAWKQGRLPRKATLERIAEYFSTTVDELLNSKTPDEELSQEQFALWGEVRDLTEDEKKKVLDFIKFTKSQREGL